MTYESHLPTIRLNPIFAWSKFSRRFLGLSAARMASPLSLASAATFRRCASKDVLSLRLSLLSLLDILSPSLARPRQLPIFCNFHIIINIFHQLFYSFFLF